MAQPSVDPHTVSDERWAVAVAREPVFRNLAARFRLTEVEVRAATIELSLSRPYFYKLLARYRADPATSSLVGQLPGPRPGTSRLSADVDRVIDETVRRFYLSRQKPKLAALCREIAHECRALGLPVPTRRAVTRRVARVNAKLLAHAREGGKAAADRFRPVVREYAADHALRVVQIDQTRVDAIVVDDWSRRRLGRPWLTLAICVASRMITGFYRTMESPSAVSVAMTLRRAVLPKAEWLMGQGITAAWPVAGLPDAIHMDNAREFHSRALARGCEEYGIEKIYRPRATPHFGGHIERLVGSMMGEVHLLPGTTFSSVAEKGDYDAEARAVMTLSELETWLAVQIAGVYHAQLHSGVKLPPNEAWVRAVARRPTPVRHPCSDERFLLDFLPFEYRKVRRDGIRLFNIRYWDPVLSVWLDADLGPMPVKYDPRNLSRVFVQAPDGEHWPIPYADLGRPPITLWEHRAASARLLEEGRRAVDERLIFAAVEAQRAIVADAALATKQARRTLARTAAALRATVDLRPVPPMSIEHAASPAPQSGDPYLPYELEEGP